MNSKKRNKQLPRLVCLIKKLFHKAQRNFEYKQNTIQMILTTILRRQPFQFSYIDLRILKQQINIIKISKPS